MSGYNVSQQLTDPFEDTNNDLLRNYQEDTVYMVFNNFRIVTDVIKLIICICVIAVDIFLLYIFCRFKKLRSQTNRYIMHYAACNILYFTFTPLLYVAIDYFFKSSNITALLCVIIQLENTYLMMCFLLASGLGIDWLITSYTTGLKETGQKIYKYSIPIIYTVGFLKSLPQISACFIDIISIRHIFSVALYFSVLVFVLILDYLSYRHQITSAYTTKSSYSLTVANIIVLPWLPMYVYHFLTQLALGNEVFELVLWYTVFIPEWVAYGNSIAVLIALAKLSKQVRIACYKVFRKPVKSYQDNSDDSYGILQRNEHVSAAYV